MQMHPQEAQDSPLAALTDSRHLPVQLLLPVQVRLHRTFLPQP